MPGRSQQDTENGEDDYEADDREQEHVLCDVEGSAGVLVAGGGS